MTLKQEDDLRTVSMPTNGQDFQKIHGENYPSIMYTDEFKVPEDRQPHSLTYAQVKLTRPNFKGSVEDYVMITNFKRFKREGSSSKYKGVFFVKKEKKYRAQICLKGKKQYIGTFNNDFDAAIARDQRIRDKYGEVEELLNFPKVPKESEQEVNKNKMFNFPEQQLLQAQIQPPQDLRRLSHNLMQYGHTNRPNTFAINLENTVYNQMIAPYFTTELGIQPTHGLSNSTEAPFFVTGSNYFQNTNNDATLYHHTLIPSEYKAISTESSRKKQRTMS